MKHLLLFFFATSVLLGSFCDEYYSKAGFGINIPEGFVFNGGNGSTTFFFASANGDVKLNINKWPSTQFASSEQGANDSIKKMAGTGHVDSFSFCNYDSSLSNFTTKLGGIEITAYGLFINNVHSVDNYNEVYDVSVFVYVPSISYKKYKDIMESSLDTFFVNSRLLGPGPVSALARSRTKTESKPVVVKFNNFTINTQWNPAEAEICQDVVEREYRVLTAYANTPSLIQPAVERFYRIIYKDAASYLDSLALDMAFAWERACINAGKPITPLDYAAQVVAWVQGFVYERNEKGSDVINPITAAFDSRGDCDSRVLLAAIILRRQNIKSILMFSFKHNHALLALDVSGQGARFPFSKVSWLVAETTDKVDIGKIDASQSDVGDWFGVMLPF